MRIYVRESLFRRMENEKKPVTQVILLLVCFAAFADHVSISGITSWSRVDTHEIIVYRGSTPIALMERMKESIKKPSSHDAS